jgi:hypothetical protein
MAIYLGNTYKNYLTIELVFPKPGAAIQNATELLDLNFNIIQIASVKYLSQDKSAWLKGTNYHLEIDEDKREKYVREVDRWLRFFPSSQDSLLIEKVTNLAEKNAVIVSESYRSYSFCV